MPVKLTASYTSSSCLIFNIPTIYTVRTKPQNQVFHQINVLLNHHSHRKQRLLNNINSM